MLQGLERIKKRAEEDEDALAVMVFGSYATGESKPSSDIDVCVVLRPEKWDNVFMSNKKLEYLGLVSDRYDVQIFQQLPVFIRKRMLKDGKFLLNKDYDLMFEVALDTIKEFDSFRRHFYYCVESVAYGR